VMAEQPKGLSIAERMYPHLIRKGPDLRPMGLGSAPVKAQASPPDDEGWANPSAARAFGFVPIDEGGAA
jgi:hypothetical protein